MLATVEVLEEVGERAHLLRRLQEVLSWGEWTTTPEDLVTRARLLHLQAEALARAENAAAAKEAAAQAVSVLAPLYGEEHRMIASLRRLTE